MINKDSIVTAYDEHLTLVEWLQKIEKLLANGDLKSTTLNDKGNATFSLTLTFNDDTTITSPDMTLTSVNEALTALNNAVTDLENGNTHLFENITDNHGRKRFIEGTFTNLSSIEVTEKYNKWSLCGTHLMGVIAVLIPAGTFKLSQLIFKMANYPSWLNNKLVAINATNPSNYGNVSYKKGVISNNDWHATPTETTPFVWLKNTLGQYGFGQYIMGVSNEDITITQEKIIRVQFDFIIDTD